MDKETVKKSIEELKKSNKRNFKQTFDLIIVLKSLNLKKPEDQIEFYHQMHYSVGKQIKICALVGPELAGQAKELFDTTIHIDDFPKYAKDKKLLKKAGAEHDFFVAQATIMPQVATTFGKILGPKGKMPNPKAGCVVPPNANLKPLVEKLKKTVRIAAKTIPMIQLAVGKEDSKEEEVIDNILTTYNDLVHRLPGGKNNIKRVLLKLTMSKPVKLE
ncbi:50S ribosomal protein L1 [Candidatus Woesearchaeota archaeon]|nr:50S ribosomal protein L1 [Candidatus Woesearchaeota archaeon]